AEHLQQVAREAGSSLDPESARLLAFRAQGGMRDALGLLEQVISFTNGEIKPDDVWQALGAIDKTSLVNLANALHSRDIGSAMRLFEQFGAMGIDYRQLLSDLLELLRQSLLEALNARPKTQTSLQVQDANAIMQ